MNLSGSNGPLWMTSMDYFEYAKKGFPLLLGAFVYFFIAGFFLLFTFQEHRFSLLWPMSLALIPGLLLLAMSLPRVFRQPVLFRSMRGSYYMLLAGVFFAWVGRIAFLAGASIRQGEFIGPLIFLVSLLIALSVAWLLRRVLEKVRTLSPMAEPYFDEQSLRIGLSSVVGWFVIWRIALL